MADDTQSESEQPSRDALAAAIRCYRYKTWGSQPTADGRWECYFDIVATRGGWWDHLVPVDVSLEVRLYRLVAEPGNAGERDLATFS